MDIILIIAGVAAAAAIGGLQLYERLSRTGKARRLLERAKLVKVGDAREGEVVRIVGRVRLDDDPLRAPLSERPCAAYEIEVEERRTSLLLQGGRWRRVLRHADHLPRFLIEDETGSAVVELGEPYVLVTHDVTESSGVGKAPPLGFGAFLAAHGVGTKGSLVNKRMCFTEGIIWEGQQLVVLGLCRWRASPSAGVGYRQAPRALHLVPPSASRQRMVLSADPKTLSNADRDTTVRPGG
jgi:hypothetical protein